MIIKDAIKDMENAMSKKAVKRVHREVKIELAIIRFSNWVRNIFNGPTFK